MPRIHRRVQTYANDYGYDKIGQDKKDRQAKDTIYLCTKEKNKQTASNYTTAQHPSTYGTSQRGKEG